MPSCRPTNSSTPSPPPPPNNKSSIPFTQPILLSPINISTPNANNPTTQNHPKPFSMMSNRIHPEPNKIKRWIWEINPTPLKSTPKPVEARLRSTWKNCMIFSKMTRGLSTKQSTNSNSTCSKTIKYRPKKLNKNSMKQLTRLLISGYKSRRKRPRSHSSSILAKLSAFKPKSTTGSNK